MGAAVDIIGLDVPWDEIKDIDDLIAWARVEHPERVTEMPRVETVRHGWAA